MILLAAFLRNKFNDKMNIVYFQWNAPQTKRALHRINRIRLLIAINAITSYFKWKQRFLFSFQNLFNIKNFKIKRFIVCVFGVWLIKFISIRKLQMNRFWSIVDHIQIFIRSTIVFAHDTCTSDIWNSNLLSGKFVLSTAMYIQYSIEYENVLSF